MSLEKELEDDDKDFFINEKEYFEYEIFFFNFKSMLDFSIFNYYLIFGIIINFIFKIILDNTKNYRFKKNIKFLKKLKNKQRRYIFLKKYEKIIFYFQKKYSKFDSYDLLYYHKGVLFAQVILDFPRILFLFSTKSYLIDKYYYIFYYLIFLIMFFFLLNYMIKYYRFLESNSFEEYKEIAVIENDNENWNLVFFQYFFICSNLVNLFIIHFFKDFLVFCFVTSIISILFQIIVYCIFFKRTLFFFIIFEIFTFILFLLWVIFVLIDKIYKRKFPLLLNIFYVSVNISKFLSELMLTFILKKLQKIEKVKIIKKENNIENEEPDFETIESAIESEIKENEELIIKKEKNQIQEFSINEKIIKNSSFLIKERKKLN